MDKSHADHIIEHFEKNAAWARERNHFFESLCAAEFHWFFVQGIDAIRNEFYVPGASSLLNGIEASLRVTIAQVTGAEPGKPLEELSPYRVLSNNLIVNASDVGMPVSALAFPGESDFLQKLTTSKPNRVDVEIVRQRNNICHGNIFEFINRDLGPENSFFTPECLRSLAYTLLEVSRVWAGELGKFRRSKGLLHYD
ncbi:hypothetical protein NUV25_33695 [Burkholderia pseudomultivorans]|uniref:hypothetical protein n=1 Tax=Burkholderia pseudomultivorans TaxID=1207504 RepID=UPI002875B9D5|nr:hypothetical protein [Burkholderia pseudomultivorans]MDS0862661.1 hypothetical protein [Burkholderia pseudomultivorans]